VRLPARWRSAFAPRLRLLVLAVADRCDQRCVHCDIWRGTGRAPLTLRERLRVVDDALSAGIDQALLTGGEPLLSADLWPVAERLASGGARLLLTTNGMLLARHAAPVARRFAEVYVSLDGAGAATHDRLRGVRSFERVAEGVAALRRLPARPTLVARCALHAGNLEEFEAVVAGARSLGFDHVSFLALDAHSPAFGGDPAARRALVPDVGQVARLEAAIARLEAGGALADGFVLDSAAKLRRLGRHLDASAGRRSHERPDCDAPWWSLVVDADGSVRPCFFHERVGDARDGLQALRTSERYRASLAAIRAPNPTCRSCVCPKRAGVGALARAWA
jgi:MoaA/NifB/PqqE/SkfB family radical SAM enzyme